jgi:hypothetical protein
MPTNAIIEFSEEELTALGLVLAQWRAQTVGVDDFEHVMLLAQALMEVDDGVLRANIDRITLRMSEAEEEVFDKNIYNTRDLKEKRASYSAHLDQIFAGFREDGRSLFPRYMDNDDDYIA